MIALLVSAAFALSTFLGVGSPAASGQASVAPVSSATLSPDNVNPPSGL